jgi:hypothetical protein
LPASGDELFDSILFSFPIYSFMASKEINVCPNCGRKLQGPEFLTSVPKMTQQVGMDFDPVSGRFLCPDCNYSGLPISVDEKGYGQIKFGKKTIDMPLTRSNPFFWQMMALSLFLIFLGLFFSNRLSGEVAVLVGGLLLIYTAFRIPKYQKTSVWQEFKKNDGKTKRD